MTLKPESYDYISGYLLEKKGEYTAYIKQVSRAIAEACRKAGITDIEITGRVKHAYSIYQKIKKRKKEIDEIYDILGIRVICQTTVECYTILAHRKPAYCESVQKTPPLNYHSSQGRRQCPHFVQYDQ